MTLLVTPLLNENSTLSLASECCQSNQFRPGLTRKYPRQQIKEQVQTSYLPESQTRPKAHQMLDCPEIKQQSEILQSW